MPVPYPCKSFATTITYAFCSFLLLLASCSNNKGHITANKETGKVLANYKEDSFKLRCARFLIGNIGQRFTSRVSYADASGRNYTAEINTLSESNIKQIWDSLGINRQTHIVYDSVALTAAYIIRNIEEALDAWHNNPLHLKIPVDTFFEYLLPYRINEEELVNWRDYFRRRYLHYISYFPPDSMNMLYLVKRINIEQTGWLIQADKGRPEPAVTQSINHFLQLKTTWGCNDISTLKLYTFRSLGIPAALEEIPYYGKFNYGHKEVAVLFENKRFYPSISDTTLFKYMIAKMYRVSFSWHKSESDYIKEAGETNENIPDYFFSNNRLDITKERTPVTDIRIKSIMPPEKRVAYLCVYNAGKWQPVEWGKRNEASDTITFPDMGRKILYHSAYMADQNLHLTGEPFILDTAGLIHPIYYDSTQKTTLRLTKYDRHGDIHPDQELEFYAWSVEKKDWIYHGTYKSISGMLLIPGAPAKALYRLHLTGASGRNPERIFTYANHQQIWF